MKANELMIGAWIKKGDTLGQVVDIDQKEKYATVGVELIGKGYDVYTVNELEPIPLTTKILEKNGFKKEGSWFIIEGDYYDVSIKEIANNIWRVKYCNTEFSALDCVLHISSVHELQHALQLCKINKTIEL